MTSADRRAGMPLQPRGEPCLDAVAVAAYIDGTLDAPERARVEAHLVRCASCREWVAETAIALEEMDDAAPKGARAAEERVSHSLSSWPRSLRYAALAAAALFVIGVGVTLVVPLLRPSSAPIASDLVAAVGNQRYVEPRTSLPFPAVEFRGPLRGAAAPSSLPPSVELHVARADEFAGQHPSDPEGLALAGVARLLAGRYDDAIAALVKATSDAPDQRRWQNDLAAAYITRGIAHGDRADLERGLAIARALGRQPPAMPEAMFNEALALSALVDSGSEDRRADARAAWDRYLAADRSAWSKYARERRDALAHP